VTDQLPSKRITILSTSCLGDKLHLYLNEDGGMWITFEEEDRAPNAHFDREQQLRLRDWLNKVLP
jgi:hypothetical protein